MEALFGILEQVDGLKTTSRRLKLWGDVPKSERPALFLTEQKDNVQRVGERMLPKVTMNAMIFIYTDADASEIPITQINDLIDAIETALKPRFPYEEQTLGGLVSHCWIDGDITKDPGDLDGEGLAMIPINILIP